MKKIQNYNVLILDQYPYYQILTKHLKDLCAIMRVIFVDFLKAFDTVD